MFIAQAAEDPSFFITIVVSVVLSITLHELAHGLTAVKLGDDTPRVLGHLTLNPVVHMPPISIIALLVAGLAWGSMPINPSRLKGRYAEAQVAFAGPAMNLSLAVVALTVLGLWQRHTGGETDYRVVNTFDFLWRFGFINIVLFGFNLLPIPPLDGSRILANFNPSYRQFLNGPNVQMASVGLLIGAFMLSSYIGQGTQYVSGFYVEWLNQGRWTFGPR